MSQVNKSNVHLVTLLKAILAGIMISLGCIAYLTVESKYMGSMLFTIGLFTIYTLDFYLYTGKIGYLLQDKDPLKIVVIWIGNLIGTVTFGFLVSLTRIATPEFIEKLQKSVYTKQHDGFVSLFVLALLCGMMMFLAAQCYRTTHDGHNSIGGYVGLFLCVMLFILCGFEHSIANMFYFTLANAWTAEAALPLLIVTVGNACGGLLLPALIRTVDRLH